MQNLYDRREQARTIRERAARNAFNRPRVEQLANGDENGLPSFAPPFAASFHKGLPQDDDGFVVPEDYRLFKRAVNSNVEALYAQIPLDPNIPDNQQRSLANPQAGLAFVLEGPEPASVTLPPAPEALSSQTAAEMVELYWQALLRDVPLIEYESNADIQQAGQELGSLSGYQGPTFSNQVTPQVIFRGVVSGTEIGPLVPQFYLREAPYNSLTVSPFQITYPIGVDYLTVFSDWLAVQRGLDTSNTIQLDDTRRLIRSLRDLAAYVRADRLEQSYLNAAQILLEANAPLDEGNPYRFSSNQGGFVTFGLEHLNTLVGEVIRRCLQAAWYQKWQVHRRFRPEVYAGRIDVVARRILAESNITYPKDGAIAESARPHAWQLLVGKAGDLPLGVRDVLCSTALERTFMRNGSFLLPQAYPEGSPTHPSYPAGHATAAGACGTILKAFFDESTPLTELDLAPVEGRKIVQANAEGTALVPYTGADANEITLGSEINKLSSHHANARSMAGVHYRSDNFQGLMLGEAVAIQLLQEQKSLFNETHSFTLTQFDGTQIVI